MKHLLILAVVSCGLIAASGDAAAQVKLENQLDSISYSIGKQIAQQLGGVPLSMGAFFEGFKEQQEGKPRLTDQQMMAYLQIFQQQMMARQQELAAQVGPENRKAQAEFLAANREKEGVQETASGLQYKVLKAGEGPSPTAKDEVTVHYHGTLLDGTVFDSSVERGEPVSFPVSGVIRGWTEALLKMKVGGKWRLFIPAELAYGEQQRGEHITPHSMLIFDVELLGIN